MSGMWKRSHGRTSEAPPDERGGYRYVRPTATAPHLDSTHLRRRRRSGIGRLTDPTAAAQLWIRAGSSCPSRYIAAEIRKRRGWKPTCVIGSATALDNRASHTSNGD